ncbi:PAS domain S-box protein [Dyadobacter subterraneus]|uniref:PAS domain S-box protein n=1 Tax=Dyadobacter subterraneus TaxID=2773304 RepID=A0ABR9WIK5_9BACT|nr:PAS domain S-box protein [Dyadobacter subterraneus]MBE9464181.1 PAS domain S-box protein [Dyadobacter subterraneus]
MEKDKNLYKILVIEDNPGDFALIEDFLDEQMVSPEIFQAKTFKEGQALLVEKGLAVNVILLDLSLPDKSGENLIMEIVALSAGIPIIVLTGYPDISFSVKSLSLGVSDYLLKDELSASNLYKSILYSIERKKKSAELEESEKRYSDLFQLSPQPMWVYDLETLKFLNVNDAAIRHYGYSLEEFRGMTIRDIRPVEELPKLEEALYLTRRQSSTFHYNGISRHRKKNGEIIQAEIQSNGIYIDGRRARVVLINDITERLRYIEAIESQNQKLQEIAWLQSHVVRAPVARLMGIVDLIKNYQHSENEQNELLDHILISANELDGIIRDIANKTQHI